MFFQSFADFQGCSLRFIGLRMAFIGFHRVDQELGYSGSPHSFSFFLSFTWVWLPFLKPTLQ